MGGSRPPWPWGLAVLLLVLAASSTDARTLFGDVQRSLLRTAPSGNIVSDGASLVETAPLQNIATSETTAPNTASGATQMNVITDPARLASRRLTSSHRNGIIIRLPSTPAQVQAIIEKTSKALAAESAALISAQSTGGIKAQSFTGRMESVLLNMRCLVWDPSAGNYGAACMDSPNGRFKVCVETDGTVVGYRDSNAAWATLTPSEYAGEEFLLCLMVEENAPNRDAQLAVLKKGDLQVVTTMYPGPAYKLADKYTPAAYVQNDGNLVVYDPGCNALAQTGTPWPRMAPPCLSEELDISPGLVYNLDDPDPASAGSTEPEVADRWDYTVLCPPGTFVTGYQYQTVNDNGKDWLVAVTEVKCSDGSTADGGGWAAGSLNSGFTPSGPVIVDIPRGSAFFSPEAYLLNDITGQDVRASAECRAGTLMAGLKGTYATPKPEQGTVSAGESVNLICRSACTEQLSSTGRATDTLRNCTNGVDRINKVGDTCSSSCGAGTINVACTALGLWKVDSTCTDMSSDTNTTAPAGDRFRNNAASKSDYKFTCPPGTYITQFPITVSDPDKRLVGFGSLTCSNSDSSGLAQATSPTYGVQAGDAYTYSRTDGFTRARIHFEQGSGILRLSVAPPTGGFPNPLAIATINSSWTNATERCPDDTRVAGVYGRYIDNGYIFTLGLTCRKVCSAMIAVDDGITPEAFGSCVMNTNVVGKTCTTTCPAGTTGTVTTTCTDAGVWQTASTCVTDLPCRGNPPRQDDNGIYNCDRTTTLVGSDCVGTCDAPNGFVGSISGTCQGSGNWTVAGSCDALTTMATFLGGTTTRVMYPAGSLTQAQAAATCNQTGGSMVEDNGAYGCEHDSQVIYMANKYHIVNRKARYGQAVAQDLCTQLGGNLSSFADVNENAKFLQELGYGTTDYTALWIGLFGDSPSPDKSAYKWISTGQSPNFQQPSSGHGFWQVLPDGTSQPSGNFSCVKMAQQYGYWADAACKTPYGFTCEIPIGAVTCPATGAPLVDNGAFTCGADAKPGDACVAKCADGYVGAPRTQCSSTGSWGTVEGSCVQAANETVVFASKRWTLFPSVFMGQQASKDFCTSTGGKLITVRTEAERTALAAKLAAYDKSVWIGLQNPGIFPSSTSSEYLWVDTSLTPTEGEKNWADQQPDGDMSGINNGGFCVVADKAAAGKWDDQPCTDANIVACEYLNLCQDTLPDIPQVTTWGTCSVPGPAGLLCNATCAENYEGSPSATCVGTSWVPDGACTPKGCSTSPEKKDNGEDFACSSTAHGSVCTAQCSTFYAGELNATCNFGNWTYGGECTSSNCTADPTTSEVGAGSFAPCSNGLALGSECVASCVDGYTGSVTATCGSGREFSNAGTCTPNDCGAPTDRENAEPFTCTTVAHGGVCTAQCSTFYAGTVNASCSLGVLTPGGECTSTNCTGSPSTTEPVGAFSCDNDAAFQSICTATCSAGYTGSVTATCGSDQQWGASSGTCTPNSCDSPIIPTPPQHTLGNVSDSCSATTHGSNCTVPCVTGYSGTVTVTCTLGDWTLADGVCSPDPCPGAPTADNTTFTGCDSTGEGGVVESNTTCAAACEDGFVASPDIGAPSATCIAGQYQYSGACVPQNCSTDPSDQANANPFVGCAQTHGTVCPSTCQTFYAGSVQATCVRGTWTYENTCASTNCTAAPVSTEPGNEGFATCSELADGSECTSTCATGYSGAGVKATCSNTSWGYTGSCTPNPCENAMVAGAPSTSVGNVSDSCVLPALHNTNCTVDCKAGYSGTVTTTCVLGVFTYVEGTCTGNPCDVAPPEIPNAMNYSCTDWSHESTCAATCAGGYTAVGNPGATCTAGQWTTDGGCAPAACGTPTQQANAAEFTSCATDVHGTTCNAECSPFHEGNVTATCKIGAWDYVNTCAPTNCTEGPSTTEPVMPGSFDCPNGLAKDSVCTATCLAGYTGTVQATCGTGRQFVNTGTCTPLGCTAPASVASFYGSPVPAAVVCSTQNPAHGDTCDVPCAADFAGSVTTTCDKGQWTNTTGACVRVAGICPGLPTVWVNGASFPDTCRNLRTGQACSTRCNQGWVGSPTPSVQCVLDTAQTNPNGGRWATSIAPGGQCLRGCPGVPPQQVEGGSWPETCRDKTSFLGLCQGVCDGTQGYIGTPMVQCLSTGWSSTVVGGCRKASAVCNTLPSIIITNGRWPQSCVQAPGNATCTALCNAPRFGGPTPPRISCVVDQNGNARWDASSLKGSCKRLCTTPPPITLAPANGAWPLSCRGTVAGESCTGTCASPLLGSPTVKCGANGAWATFVSGQCQQEPVCSSLPSFSVKDGSWPDSCFNANGNFNCTVQCKTGFSTTQPAVATCVKTSTTAASWVLQSPSSALTNCQRVCSGTPTAVLANGVWPASCANTDAPCTGVCNTTGGFVGSPTVTCTSNGWSTTVVGRCSSSPVCLGKPQTALNGGFGLWPNSCADANLNSTCNAACDYGYGGPNQPKVTCGSDGQWAATSTGVCQKVCMGSPLASLLPGAPGASWGDCAGKVVFSGTCPGSCGTGWSGTPQVQCLPTGSWATSLLGNVGCTQDN